MVGYSVLVWRSRRQCRRRRPIPPPRAPRLQAIINTTFLPFTEPELLSLAKTIEGVARLAFTAQVRIAGAIDQQKMAESFGAATTSALLRQTLQITNQDARLRVNTAKAVLPQDAISGGTSTPSCRDWAPP